MKLLLWHMCLTCFPMWIFTQPSCRSSLIKDCNTNVYEKFNELWWMSDFVLCILFTQMLHLWFLYVALNQRIGRSIKVPNLATRDSKISAWQCFNNCLIWACVRPYNFIYSFLSTHYNESVYRVQKTQQGMKKKSCRRTHAAQWVQVFFLFFFSNLWWHK